MLDQSLLAVIFIALMGLSILLYAILDGYDLGVGMLIPLDDDAQSDTMIASIGPFWDANETWLVLAVGLMLIAFPAAHSMVLKALYLPAVVLLIGLIMRGVAFDFRAKAVFSHKPTWNKVFKFGSLIASLSQGYMLGLYIMAFEQTWQAYAFACLSALGVAAAYSFIGACWLVMKTEHQLQQRAIVWAKKTGVISFVGILLVSVVNLSLDATIFAKWFSWPNGVWLLPLPIICGLLFSFTFVSLKRLTIHPTLACWHPFVATVGIFSLSFFALGFSFFPDIVPGKLTIWQAVAAPESLSFLFWGAIVVIPTILLYTAFSYRVFWGKVQDLKYY